MAVNYGAKRLVVGANTGTGDWVTQLATALVMGLFVVLVLARWCYMGLGETGQALSSYEQWAGVFAPHWMKFLAVAVAIALGLHTWGGFRSVSLDYIQATGLRLLLQIAALVWIVGCIGWLVQVLWSI